MDQFDTPKWESNAIGDAACKEFSKVPKFGSKSQKNKKPRKVEKTFKRRQVGKPTEKQRNKSPLSKEFVHLKPQDAEKFKNKVLSDSMVANISSDPINIKDTSTERNVKRIYSNLKQKVPKKSVKNKVQIVKKKRQPTGKEQSGQIPSSEINVVDPVSLKKANKVKRKILSKLPKQAEVNSIKKKKKKENQTLRERMLAKLKAARFRFINEQMYSTDGDEAMKMFQKDPAAYKAYHEGYRLQVDKWPLNPLDVIIENIKKMSKKITIADFGCGDAKLAQNVEQTVHSFDLVAVNENVTACNMAKVPLENASIDVAVFCLSLMGTNLHDYLCEANRVLKMGGILKIAEVESRFDKVENFIEGVEHFGFKKTWSDLSHNLFYFMDFKKQVNVTNKKNLPTVSLHPCLYKKR